MADPMERFQRKIEVLALKLGAVQKEKRRLLTDPDLSDSARNRLASQLWSKAAADVAAEFSGMITGLKRDRDSAMSRAAAARQKAGQAFDYGRLNFEVAELRARFASARDIAALRIAYQTAAQLGDPHTKRAASVAVVDAADRLAAGGTVEQRLAANRLKTEAQAAIDELSRSQAVLEAEADVEQLTRAALEISRVARKFANEFGADGQPILAVASRVRANFNSADSETIVDLTDDPAPAGGLLSAGIYKPIKEA